MLLAAYAMWNEGNKNEQPEQKEFSTQAVINLDGVLAPDGQLYNAINQTEVLAPASTPQEKPEKGNGKKDD